MHSPATTTPSSASSTPASTNSGLSSSAPDSRHGRATPPPPASKPSPSPTPPPNDGKTSQEEAIAEAARELNDLREEWLNPKDWTREEILEFLGSTDGPWADYLHDPDSSGIGTVRYPRTVPREPISNPDDDPDNPETDFAALLADRTLTKLYNQRPTWLDLAHQKLDQAVCDAYGWDPEITDEKLLEKLLALNPEAT